MAMGILWSIRGARFGVAHGLLARQLMRFLAVLLLVAQARLAKAALPVDLNVGPSLTAGLGDVLLACSPGSALSGASDF